MSAGSLGCVPDLDHDSPVPLWEQLANRLRADIESGRLTGRIPSAAALARAYSVSRDTALRALAELGGRGADRGEARPGHIRAPGHRGVITHGRNRNDHSRAGRP